MPERQPATSTAGAILTREGLVKPRRKRSPRTHPGVVDPITDVPNDLWTADFKGQFREYGLPRTIRPPKATARAQQRAFDVFRDEYNEERPHSHHGGAPPSDHYVASSREYPSRLPALEYPGHYTVRRVTTVGTSRFQNKLLSIANARRGYHIGLEEEADGIWSIDCGTILLAKLDERDDIIRE